MLWAYVNIHDIPLKCTDRISLESVQKQYVAQEWWKELIFVQVLLLPEVRDGAVGWGTALQAGRSRVRFTLVSSFRPHYGPRVDSASNKNEYQKYLLRLKVAGV